ncbi:unnamed protein product (macronuclear) [Paramecium tetraurelia]|uniref:Methionyl/Leucyl tRNA synthetase domain-containing protein n=1 Tax=Paramecium tetraurelia TaxID=5888 RepID=A0BJP4_PARTE|nr:uncharacterized protein GSPATT00029389001 [Paramecium tetraurelia]CAK58761.1 unnamed protein product [Paramecium tetraurelia]|eukprot:XP_001426159.1 hypothetical protein (macronuclear) [Paramecium tetraurelia strain d4-2]
MHSFQQQELIELLQSHSNIAIDRQLISQLYNKCMQDQCTIQQFEKVYKDAIQLLSQKIANSKQQLIEEQDNLTAIDERLKNNQLISNNNNRTPMRLMLHSASVLNLQVHNKFMVGQYAFYMKIEDYYEFESDFKPSYNLQFQLNQTIDILDVGDSILLSLNTNTQNQMNTTIVIPTYSLQFNKHVTELLAQKENGELLEMEITYEIKVLDQKLLNLQLNQARSLVVSYIKKFEDELEDYSLQLQDLRQIKIPYNNEIANELNDGQPHHSRQEQSNNTYTIGVPDYYHKPLELQSQDCQLNPQPQERQSSVIPYLFGIILASFNNIFIDTLFEISFLMIVLIVVLKEDKTTVFTKIMILLSWIMFGLHLWLHQSVVRIMYVIIIQNLFNFFMIKQIITTPLFYVNAQPHIGHLYSMIYADAIAKYKSVKLLTGTDEHGLKVYRSAKNQPIQQYCDSISNQFQQLANSFIKYDHFVRTTDPQHIMKVQKNWNLLQNNGFILKDTYKGYYCQVEESFVNHKTDQYLEEENYFFKFDKDYLETCITKAPSRYQNELKQLIINSICISRPKQRYYWGIEVPNDANQLIYVWLDALLGYLQEEQHHYMHVIGKDIVRFHALYWPSFLKGINNQSTTELIVHNHWIRNNMKMSKSLGNVIDPFQLLKTYNQNQIRLYFLTQGPQNMDVSFEEQKLEKCWNTYIDQFNNILFRLFRPKIISPNLLLLQQHLLDDQLLQSKQTFLELHKNTKALLDKNLFIEGYLELQKIFVLINTLIDKYQPWKMQVQFQKEQFLSFICILISMTQQILDIYVQTPNIISPQFKEFPQNNNVQVTVDLEQDLRLKRFIIN